MLGENPWRLRSSSSFQPQLRPWIVFAKLFFFFNSSSLFIQKLTLSSVGSSWICLFQHFYHRPWIPAQSTPFTNLWSLNRAYQRQKINKEDSLQQNNYGLYGTQVLKLFALSALHSDKAYQTLYAAYLIYAELILFYNVLNNNWQANISAKFCPRPVKQIKGGTLCNICWEYIIIVTVLALITVFSVKFLSVNKIIQVTWSSQQINPKGAFVPAVKVCFIIMTGSFTSHPLLHSQYCLLSKLKAAVVLLWTKQYLNFISFLSHAWSEATHPKNMWKKKC